MVLSIFWRCRETFTSPQIRIIRGGELYDILEKQFEYLWDDEKTFNAPDYKDE